MARIKVQCKTKKLLEKQSKIVTINLFYRDRFIQMHRLITLQDNQRTFLLEISRKFLINNPQDWGNMSIKKITDNGGHGLLNYYDQSLFKTLKSVFPGSSVFD